MYMYTALRASSIEEVPKTSQIVLGLEMVRCLFDVKDSSLIDRF